MFLSELKVHAAVLSDEDPDIQTVVRYANSRIAHVNRVAKTKFPFFNLEAFNPEEERLSSMTLGITLYLFLLS